MDWEKAKVSALERWGNLDKLAEARDVEAFRATLLDACAFCATAQEEIDSLGVPKVKMYTCDYCRGYLDFGGCQEPLDSILKALDAGDWAKVREVIKQVQGLVGQVKASQHTH